MDALFWKIQNTVIEGKVKVKIGPDRRRISLLRNVRQWLGQTLVNLFREASDKVKWVIVIASEDGEHRRRRNLTS